MVRSQKGFTIIELVVVIVILGILAAVALPRFANLTTDARIAAVNGIAGGLRSAVVVSQSRYYATGTNTSPITMADGTTVAVGVLLAASGVPTVVLGGIGNAMRCESAILCQGVNVSIGAGAAGDMNDWRPAGGSATCQASYAAATGVVTVTVTGC